MRLRDLRVVLGAWGLILVLGGPGCMIDVEQPQGNIPTDPPPSCGDGVCDPTREDCFNCPEECPCCRAIRADGTDDKVQDAANAVGEKDGKVARLEPLSILILVAGRNIVDQGVGTGATAVDFTLVGQVKSNSGTVIKNSCSAAGSGSGAFEISVSADGVGYQAIGLWTAQNYKFDLGCANVRNARYVRIRGQPEARGTLDAMEISPASCPEK